MPFCSNYKVNIKLYKLFSEFIPMFWNKKKGAGDDKSLPDLPPLKETYQKKGVESNDSGFIQQAYEKNDLPTFPDSADRRGFSQSAIKDAVGSVEDEEFNEEMEDKTSEREIKGERGKFKTMEIDEDESGTEQIAFTKPIKKITVESEDRRDSGIPPLPVNKLAKEEVEAPSRLAKKSSGDVFVKIDKFHSARRSLADVEDKLDEISSLLTKIREVKLREEQEITGWEKDMDSLKTRLSNLTVDIFEKTE